MEFMHVSLWCSLLANSQAQISCDGQRNIYKALVFPPHYVIWLIKKKDTAPRRVGTHVKLYSVQDVLFFLPTK